MQIQSRYSFFPVGQGTFSGGMLEFERLALAEFWWVYDCGCVKGRQSQLRDEIERLALLVPICGTSHRPKLNLLFVSHFDLDHVSGLVELLLRFEIDTLVLPLIPLWKRVAMAISKPYSRSPYLRNFVMDPLGFLARLKGVSIRKIYLVSPSAPDSSLSDNDVNDFPQNPTFDDLTVLTPSRLVDEPADENYADIAIALAGQLPFVVQTLAPGGKLRLGNVWEFIPYNETKLWKKATPTFCATATRVASAFLNAPSAKRRPILSRLEGIYDRTFGRKPKERNQISLFVYAGPIGKYDVLSQKSCRFSRAQDISSINLASKCSAGQCAICSHHNVPNLKTGILYTGDGYLKSVSSFNDLRTYYGHQRIANLDILQVMHHGSKANWHLGIAAKISPTTSVYCADPNYTHKHPHEQVKRDFSSYGPQLVNWKLGYTSFQSLRW